MANGERRRASLIRMWRCTTQPAIMIRPLLTGTLARTRTIFVEAARLLRRPRAQRVCSMLSAQAARTVDHKAHKNMTPQGNRLHTSTACQRCIASLADLRPMPTHKTRDKSKRIRYRTSHNRLRRLHLHISRTIFPRRLSTAHKMT